jgi:hypothetical protein
LAGWTWAGLLSAVLGRDEPSVGFRALLALRRLTERVEVERDQGTRRLLHCGVMAGPLFVGTFLVEGVTRNGYRPTRHPVSSLALGSHGWLQLANFAVTGGLYLAGSVGLHRASLAGTRTGPVLVGAAAVGLLGAAAFRTDPVSGYPPGTPDVPPRHTTVGTLHDLFSAPTFLGLPAAGLVFARAFLRRGHRGWAAYSAGSGLAMLAGFALATAGFTQRPGLVNIAGALQRVSVTIGFTWLSALASRSLRALSEAERDA